MKSIDPAARARPAKLQNRFEELRMAYQARLHGERDALIVLLHRLQRGERQPLPLYDEIRRLAHSMAGAAAVFELSEVPELAHSVEDAATRATRRPGAASNTILLKHLNGLVASLIELLDAGFQPASSA